MVTDFLNEKCKVADMMRCGKEQWLKEYSYMTAEEYDATIGAVLNALQTGGYFDKYSIKEYKQIEREWAEREVE